MNLIKSFFLISLFSIALISEDPIDAMQPLKDFNGPVKAVFSRPGSIKATLPDGSQIFLDPSIQWNFDDGILAPMKPRSTVQTTAAAAIATQVVAQMPTPKIPAIQATPTTATYEILDIQETPKLKIGGQPPKIQCTDTTVEYDSEALRVLKSDVFSAELLKVAPRWNGRQYAWKGNIIKLPIDSKGFAFMLTLASKTDEQIFNFIDSLDDQTFRLISFYTQLLKERRISDLLKYKILKNTKLRQLAELADSNIKAFIAGKYGMDWNNTLQRQETLFNKYIDSNKNENYRYVSSENVKIDSIHALLVLIDFYQETLKKPLPLDTDHLKNLFYSQPSDIQQKLLNTNLITLA